MGEWHIYGGRHGAESIRVKKQKKSLTIETRKKAILSLCVIGTMPRSGV